MAAYRLTGQSTRILPQADDRLAGQPGPGATGGIRLGGVRKPRPRPEPVRWLREELPRLVDRVDRRALLIGGGALVGAAVLVWAIVAGPFSSDDERRCDQGGHGRRRDRRRQPGAGRGARLPAGRDPEHDPGRRSRPGLERGCRRARDPPSGARGRTRSRPPSSYPTTTGRRASPPLARRPATARAAPDRHRDLAARPERRRARPAPAPRRWRAVRTPPSTRSATLPPRRRWRPSGSRATRPPDRGRDRPAAGAPPQAGPRAHRGRLSEEAAFAMPAAAWAARSSDPVLFTKRDEVPEATLKALGRHRGAPVYVLGGRDRDLRAGGARARADLAGRQAGRRRRPGRRTRSISPATPTRASAGTSTTPATGWCSPTTRVPLDAAAAALSRRAAPGARCF